MSIKEIIIYILGVSAIVTMTYMWHEADKRGDALQIKLDQADALIQLKDKEYDRVGNATLARDERFDQQDKILSDIQKALRVLQRNDEKIRNTLATIVPPESLRGLRSYANSEHKAEGAGASTPAPTNTDKP